MNISFKSDIIAISSGFSKIIFGTGSLKRVEKVYSSFHISSSETIMAYIKSTVPFVGPLIVITDFGIYSFLTNPLPISNLCGYLVTMADAKAPVTISNADGSRDVLGGSFVAQNTAGIELSRFMKALQKQLLQTYPWAKQQRDTLVNAIMSSARSEMKTGRISAEKNLLLDALAEETAYCDSVALLQGEDIFRSCNYGDYQKFVVQQENKVLYATRSTLLSNQNRFLEGLAHDLGDIALDFDRNYLETAYRNMSQLTSYSDNQCLILAYLCARLGKEEQFQTVRGQVSRRCGEDKAQTLEFFKGRYFNNRMSKVYEMVKHGTMPPAEWLDWTDGAGLSALHYAILLNQESLVEELLDKRVWAAHAPVSDEELEPLYDYTVLACYKNLSNRSTVFKKTSTVVAAQLRVQKALERKLWLKQRKLDIQNASARKAKDMIHTARKNGLYDKEMEWREKLDTVSMLRDETQMELDDINHEISEIDHEINMLASDAMVSAADTLHRLQSSTNPFVRYLLYLFSDTNALLHVLSEQQGTFRLYNYGDFRFVAPADVLIDLPYTTDQAQHEGHQDYQWSQKQEHRSQREQQKSDDGPITKPFGTSWFSPEAHRDMKKLRQEYHQLAKQYHPDLCHHPRSKEVFQEILNERADILEHMD